MVDEPGVARVERDQPIERATESGQVASRVAETRAPESPYLGFDGSGQTIAVVDSGVDGTHPMFLDPSTGESKVVRNFRVACLNNPTYVAGESPEWRTDGAVDDDEFSACPSRVTGDGADDEPLLVEVTDLGNNSEIDGGHGTLVASAAAGVEVTTKETVPRTLSGVAPGAKIVAFASGMNSANQSRFVAHDWIARHRDNPCGDGSCPPITVVNNSFASPLPWESDSVGARLQRALVDAGVSVVWANGNSAGDGTISRSNSEGTAPIPGVVSIANYDDRDTGTRQGGLAPSSSRGSATDPTTWPDLSAPGTDITSACRPHLPDCNLDEDTNYGTHTGTSLAAPHVAGAIAILQDVALSRPAPKDTPLSPAEVEDLLEDTAYKFGTGYRDGADQMNPDNSSSFDKGHGLLDVVRAIEVLLVAPPTDPPPLELCSPGAPLARDAANDATFVGTNDTTVTEPSLDVLSVDVAGDSVTGTLSVVIKVRDLAEVNPAGAIGIAFDGFITAGEETFDYFAQRTAGGVVFGAGGVRVTGAFDAANDQITIVVPAAAVHLGGQVTVSALADGFSRRTFPPSSVGPAADSYSGVCPRTIDVGGAPKAGLVAAPGAPATWTGYPRTVVTDPLGRPVQVTGPNVEERKVEVVATGSETLVFSLRCPDPDALADYDIRLAGPDGVAIGSGTSASAPGSSERIASCRETITVTNAPAGIYTARVVAWTTVEAPFTATISIE